MARKKTARAISEKSLEKLSEVYTEMIAGLKPVDIQIISRIGGFRLSGAVETSRARWYAKQSVASLVYHELKNDRDIANTIQHADLGKLRACVQSAVMQAFRYIEGTGAPNKDQCKTYVLQHIISLNNKNDWGLSDDILRKVAELAVDKAFANIDKVRETLRYMTGGAITPAGT